MKFNKKKIVFVLILLFILVYIIVYAVTLFKKDDEAVKENNEVPKFKDEQKEYESKLDAINDLKEVKQTNAPSIYDERLLDSTGTYDPELMSKDKQRIIDSIYRHGQLEYTQSNSYNNTQSSNNSTSVNTAKDSLKLIQEKYLSAKRMGVAHEQFFLPVPHKTRTQKSNRIRTKPFMWKWKEIKWSKRIIACGCN